MEKDRQKGNRKFEISNCKLAASFLLFIFFASLPLSAMAPRRSPEIKQDESLGLYQRTQTIQMDRHSSMDKKKFTGAGGDIALRSFSPGDKADRTKSFLTSDSPVQRKFLGIQNPWFGKKAFSSAQANIPSTGSIPNAHSTYSTGAAPIPNLFDSDKKLPTTAQVPTRSSPMRGTAQSSIDYERQKAEQVSIEDIKKLLNSPSPLRANKLPLRPVER